MIRKEYELFGIDDYKCMSDDFKIYFEEQLYMSTKFKPLRVSIKEWRKPKTSKQHRAYWALIGSLKNAFFEKGYIYNQEQLHEFIKRASGFTETKEMPDGSVITVTKSLADQSTDATSRDINFLIEFIMQFAAEKLEVFLKVDNFYD